MVFVFEMCGVSATSSSQVVADHLFVEGCFVVHR